MKKVFCEVTTDLVCVLVFAVPIFVYNLSDVVPVNKLGFFCSDNSIRYPFRNSTVSSAVMVVVAFCIMLLASLIAELWLYRRHRWVAVYKWLHPVVAEMYRAVGYFTIGVAMTQFVTDVLKNLVGRLRPHFFDLCQPNINCSVVDPHTYFADYQCTRTSHPDISPDEFTSRLIDARKSFPSGHASISMFSSFYIIIYLEYRLRSQNTRILRHLFQLGVMAYGIFVAFSRVIDFKHRFSDVVGGLVLGAVVGFFSTYLFIRSSRSKIRKKLFSGVKPGVSVTDVQPFASYNNTQLTASQAVKPPAANQHDTNVEEYTVGDAASNA